MDKISHKWPQALSFKFPLKATKQLLQLKGEIDRVGQLRLIIERPISFIRPATIYAIRKDLLDAAKIQVERGEDHFDQACNNN